MNILGYAHISLAQSENFNGILNVASIREMTIMNMLPIRIYGSKWNLSKLLTTFHEMPML